MFNPNLPNQEWFAFQELWSLFNYEVGPKFVRVAKSLLTREESARGRGCRYQRIQKEVLRAAEARAYFHRRERRDR